MIGIREHTRECRYTNSNDSNTQNKPYRSAKKPSDTLHSLLNRPSFQAIENDDCRYHVLVSYITIHANPNIINTMTSPLDVIGR